MKRVAIIFTFFNDIKTVYGVLTKETPLTVSFSADREIASFNWESVSLYFFGTKEKIAVSLTKVTDSSAVFEKIGNIEDDENLSGVAIDYKKEFRVAILNDSNFDVFKDYCKEINVSSKNKLSLGLKEAIKRGERENQELFSFLFQINSKLDEVLSILKPSVKAEGCFSVQSVSVSSSWVWFFTEKNLGDVSRVFVHIQLVGSGENIEFAIIGKPDVIKLNPDGSGIYRVLFKNLDEDIKDCIITFIFAKEREILKEARI